MTILSSGTLYIIATPIGNREDISLRALSVLKSADAILVEDTRHSCNLLKYYGVNKPLITLHNFNEQDKVKRLIEKLKAGQSLALISDAGTPLISDPGFILVRLAREQGLTVTSIPGACALITALSGSGIACDKFLFAGFLKPKPTLRQKELLELKNQQITTVIYEAPHRLLACLQDIRIIFGNDYCLGLAKELTKTYETFKYQTIDAIITWLEEDISRQKGEFVLILPAVLAANDTASDEKILRLLLEELPLKKAVAIAQELSSSSKNELYQLALEIKAHC